MRTIINDSVGQYIEVNGQPLTYEDGLDDFIIEWDTVFSGNIITLPLSNYNGSLFDFYIDWGDGSPIQHITEFDSPDRKHTYTIGGIYQTTIKGICEGWAFANNGVQNYSSRLNIKKILGWGRGFKHLEYGFYACENLTEIPNKPIPRSGGGCVSMNFLFYSCSSLTSIPSGLFDKHPNIEIFNGTFAYSSLTSIPSGLFDKQVNLTNGDPLGSLGVFNGTFAHTNINSIPSGLFDKNINLTSDSFLYTFQDTNITSIPSGLFDKNVNVSAFSFNSTFSLCANLETIPEGLFRYNTKCEFFNNCFALLSYQQSKLQLNKWIFYLPGEENTRFFNQSPNFEGCFSRSETTGPYYGLQGEAPELWNCDYGTGTPITTLTYGGSANNTTSLSNYNDIPSAWK